jgi:predicted transcriptional regulator
MHVLMSLDRPKTVREVIDDTNVDAYTAGIILDALHESGLAYRRTYPSNHGGLDEFEARDDFAAMPHVHVYEVIDNHAKQLRNTYARQLDDVRQHLGMARDEISLALTNVTATEQMLVSAAHAIPTNTRHVAASMTNAREYLGMIDCRLDSLRNLRTILDHIDSL